MKTPIYTGILQSDLDFAAFKAANADLSAYAGSGLTWNPITDKFDATGDGGGSGLDSHTVIATDIGMVGDGVTDNTTVLQTWLNSVQTAKVNATLLVPDGVYIFSGPLQDPTGRNAQILLPALPSGPKTYSLTIKGYHSIGNGLVALFDMLPPQGAIFKSTLAVGSGTLPSFIEGRAPGGLYNEVTTITLNIENMIFQTVQNPPISCLNLYRVGLVNLLGDVLIISGDNPVPPTTSNSYGVLLSGVNTTMLDRVDNLIVFNFYNGVYIGELAHINNVQLLGCVNALEFGFTYHANLIHRVLDWHCTNGIKVTGQTAFSIEQYDVERSNATDWTTRVYDIVDPSNQAIGDVTWWVVQGGIGWDTTYTANGGTGIKTRRIGTDTHAGPVYIGPDLRLVSISGGGKLQARNPSTNTWADVDQWTNP